MITEMNMKKTPMEIKKQLSLANGYNYSVRKFHLQSDKFGSNLLPTQPSVANLLVDVADMVKGSKTNLIDSPQLGSMASKNTFSQRKRHSLPPLSPITNLDKDEFLPELTGMKAKIEQHIEKKQDRRNVSILISRNREKNLSRTPSFMKDDSGPVIIPDNDSMASVASKAEKEIGLVLVVNNEDTKEKLSKNQQKLEVVGMKGEGVIGEAAMIV